ncbi:hypothetical protein HUA74_14760 [Myxococcus sp. CA051A]|uniref:Uncharacterized protein n=1 Tax=Myxococcus llanfairpwllgwyngyllgogerychwyrndrobwllllantysiliogogogochensis TaxID=2590453 RepID=A0A540X2B6_9BACT|nr:MULTISPECIES: hypothetical protein [Myxococcus]NTX03925.1 hypothetical protein [Myxococcus sp. CA040A]NTX13463.1 hypothetical protein [Myxococcus sp. CA056]NTX35677.1 hypothetical protein [Myxococcus sp. CA033]NTX57479.1 hypothetical protein [Myxococcus sp. CA039A]NTX61921.1 hypothetical protein [Myxococcus sp. CA051A]
MPQFARDLDVYQGFNFKKDKQTPVGFITSITVGGIVLVADQETIADPEQPDKALATKCVGVLNSYLWETGVTDALYLSAQISTANKQKIAEMLLGTFSNIEVVMKYVIYEYDPLAKKYFKSNFVDADLNGLLEKNGDRLNINVADNESREVQSPKNFTFQIGVKPKTLEQSINVAAASSKNIVKKWGVTETA